MRTSSKHTEAAVQAVPKTVAALTVKEQLEPIRDTFSSFMNAVEVPRSVGTPEVEPPADTVQQARIVPDRPRPPEPVKRRPKSASVDWLANLPGIIDLHKRPKVARAPHVGAYLDFWRDLPIANPFEISAAYDYDMYTKAVQDYQRAVGPNASVIPHLATAAELGYGRLTSAQLSSIAARAVRFAASKDQFGDAFDIVESLCNSSHVARSPGEHRVPKASIKFRTQVSPALSYHALLHQLLRANAMKAAGNVAGTMMKRGVMVRSATLIAVVRALAQLGPELPLPGEQPPCATSELVKVQTVQQGNNLFKHAVNQSRFPGIRTAFLVASHALSRGYENIDGLYSVIAEACVARGERVIASILYDGMLRYTKGQWTLNRPECVALQEEIREKLLHAIRLGMRNTDQDEGRSLRLQQESLQALLNMVVIHEDSRFTGLRVGELGELFNTLAVCEPSSHEAWVFRAGAFTRVNVYAYVQSFALQALYGVLNRDLAGERWRRNSDWTPEIEMEELPLVPHELSRTTYRALIQYACHVLRAPLLAVRLLEHMAYEHEPRRDNRTCVILTRYGLHMLAGVLSPRALQFVEWDPARIHHNVLEVPRPWCGWDGALFDDELQERFDEEFRKTCRPHKSLRTSEDL